MMLDFQQKRKLKSKVYHPYTSIALGVLVLLALHSSWSVYTKKRESEELRSIAEAKVKELTIHEAQTEANIQRLSTPEGIEGEIRSKFNVAKQRENMVILVDDDATTTTPLPQKKTLWQRFKAIF